MDFDEFNNYATASVILPNLIGLIFFGRLGPFAKMVFGLAFLGLITEITAIYFVKGNNFPVYNIYLFLEYMVIAGIYYKNFDHQEAKKLILMVSILFIFFGLIGLLFVDGLFAMNSVTLMLKSFIISGFALYSFQQLMKNDPTDHLRNPVFYFSLGMLIYFVGNLFTFGYGQKFFSDPDEFPFDVWDIHAVFNIIFHLSLVFAIWTGRRKIST